MPDDAEHVLWRARAVPLRQPQAAYLQVHRLLVLVRKLRIGSLLHPVMQKGVCGGSPHGSHVTSREEQSCSDRRLQVRRRGLSCLLTDDRQGVEITAVARTRGEGDYALGTTTLLVLTCMRYPLIKKE